MSAQYVDQIVVSDDVHDKPRLSIGSDTPSPCDGGKVPCAWDNRKVLPKDARLCEMDDGEQRADLILSAFQIPIDSTADLAQQLEPGSSSYWTQVLGRCIAKGWRLVLTLARELVIQRLLEKRPSQFEGPQGRWAWHWF